MDKIQKALLRLSTKEQCWVKEILKKLEAREMVGLNIQKLKGHPDIYRARKGDIRIIVQKKSESYFLLAIERRNDNTYRDY